MNNESIRKPHIFLISGIILIVSIPVAFAFVYQQQSQIISQTIIDVGGGPLLLYVTGDDGSKTDWTRVGTSPYLDVIDYDVNYVSINTKKIKSVGDFDFDDSQKSIETINSVTLQLYAESDVVGNNLTVELFVYVSESEQSWESLGSQETPTSAGWMSWDVTSWLDTWLKIDNAKISIHTEGGNIIWRFYYVDCARLQIDYT
ncbi:MAG: hypothetical protein NWF13_07945 [Candidatus Bathyarchaeota archaeon]|nr:hypothetical protein [Candidatus Bathyarchaeota archaeon]